MARQPQPRSFLPFGVGQARNLILWIAYPVSLTAIVPARGEVGLDNLQLATVLLMAFLMYLADMFTNTHISLRGLQSGGPGLLTWYALAFVVIAFWQRRNRWREIRSGKKWIHTGSLGVSRLEFLPFRLDRIYRNIEPGLAFMCGMALKNLGYRPLGLWLMFAALCWRITEEQVYQMGLKQFFAEGNALLEAKVRAQRMKRSSEADEDAPPLSRRETGGVPTGIDSALEAVIAQRRREAAEAGYEAKKTEVYQ